MLNKIVAALGAGGIIAILAWWFPDPLTRIRQLWAPPQQQAIAAGTIPPKETTEPKNPSAPSTSGTTIDVSGVTVRRPKPRPPIEEPTPSYLNAGLSPMEAGTWPWAVVVYGDPGADEITVATTDILIGRDRPVVSLFRDKTSEQKVATELFRGNGALASTLKLDRYCARMLVGRLTTSPLGSTDGLFIARATLNLRLLSPDGRAISATEISEKGGGVSADAARARAVEELESVLPQRLSEFL